MPSRRGINKGNSLIRPSEITEEPSSETAGLTLGVQMQALVDGV